MGSTVAIVLLVRTKEAEIARRKLFLLTMNLNSHVRDLEIQVEPLSETNLAAWFSTTVPRRSMLSEQDQASTCTKPEIDEEMGNSTVTNPVHSSMQNGLDFHTTKYSSAPPALSEIAERDS